MAWRQLSALSASARAGVCSVCGTEAKVKEYGAYSTDVYIDFEGDFEICGGCVMEAGHLAGLVDPDALAEAVAEVETLRAYAEEVYAELSHRDQTIESLSAALAKTAAERDERHKVELVTDRDAIEINGAVFVSDAAYQAMAEKAARYDSVAK